MHMNKDDKINWFKNTGRIAIEASVLGPNITDMYRSSVKMILDEIACERSILNIKRLERLWIDNIPMPIYEDIKCPGFSISEDGSAAEVWDSGGLVDKFNLLGASERHELVRAFQIYLKHGSEGFRRNWPSKS